MTDSVELTCPDAPIQDGRWPTAMSAHLPVGDGDRLVGMITDRTNVSPKLSCW